MIQVPKNNKFRTTRSRCGQENPKKEVEPAAPKILYCTTTTANIIYSSLGKRHDQCNRFGDRTLNHTRTPEEEEQVRH